MNTMKVLECDHDVNPTRLFKNIETINYDAILPILLSEERDTEEWKVFCEEVMNRVNQRIK